MSTTATTATDTDRVVEKLIHRVSKDQLKKLIEMAGTASGELVGNDKFESGDEICPTFHFPYPCPPRFDQFLNQAALLGKIRLFPYGVIADPKIISVQVGIQNIAL